MSQNFQVQQTKRKDMQRRVQAEPVTQAESRTDGCEQAAPRNPAGYRGGHIYVLTPQGRELARKLRVQAIARTSAHWYFRVKVDGNPTAHYPTRRKPGDEVFYVAHPAIGDEAPSAAWDRYCVETPDGVQWRKR